MAAKSKMTADGRRVNVAAPRQKSAFLAKQNVVRTAQTEDERRLKRFRKMSTAQLVALGCRCLDDQRKARAEYDLICTLLGDRFPQVAVKESIPTEHGTAERVVRNVYIIEQSRIGDLRAMLDLQYSDYVTADVTYSVPHDRIDALRTALGETSGEYVREDIVYKTTPLLRSHLRDRAELAARLEGMVRVVSKVAVTITPVTS